MRGNKDFIKFLSGLNEKIKELREKVVRDREGGERDTIVVGIYHTALNDVNDYIFQETLKIFNKKRGTNGKKEIK